MKKSTVKVGRLIFIVVSLTVVFVFLLGRLTYLMALHGSDYKKLALSRQQKTIELAPKRGDVVDRNGAPLALSASAYRIDADLSVLDTYLHDKKLSQAAVVSELSPLLGIDQVQLTKTLNSVDSKGNPLEFVSIKRKVEKDTVDAVNALKLKGIIVSSDTKRIYPNGSFLAHVLGTTNMDGNGVSGVELSYNSDLQGKNGIKYVETDAHNSALPYIDSTVVQPIDGKNIELTIDERIQELAERVAKETLEENSAKSVSITIMDPKTGEILALANYPGYDPNNPTQGASDSNAMQEMWKNSAISNIFEPGSIFKVITAGAALTYNAVPDGEIFQCNGSTKVANITLRCDAPHGTQTFADIIKNSCNVGFIKVGSQIGKENFYDFVKQMNFGQKSGVDLPGESAGIVGDIKKIGPVEFATNSYGQGVAVNQVQYLAAFNAVANGGTWIRPHAMKQIYHMEDDKKVLDREYSDYGKKTVMDSDKAAELRTYLEKVVDEGTSVETKIDGYRIAGKTGTANKVNLTNGGYEKGKYVSSFAGMAPTDDPKVTLIVTVEEPNPEKYFAAETAVPAAKKLFMELFSIMNIPPSK